MPFGFKSKKDKSSPGTPSGNSKQQQNPYANMTNDPYTQTHYQPAYSQREGSQYGGSTASTLVNAAPSERSSHHHHHHHLLHHDHPQQQQQVPPQRVQRPGGYGGLGNTEEEDTNRDALFAGASRRAPAANQSSQSHYGQQQSGVYGGEEPTYTPYGEQRQLTAEEEEEEDINATKQNIRSIKQDDVAATRRILQMADEAEQSGRDTLGRLAAQGERIHNTEKNLDLASNHQRIATEKAKELKKLNGSMFAVHASNPFTKASRNRQRDEDILNRHQSEREAREAHRDAAFRSGQRVQDVDERTRKANMTPAMRKANLAERAQYQFEADSEDDEMEEEIEGNLDALQGAAGRLHALAIATGEEVEDQNKKIDILIGKSDKVDDQIHMNQARLNRIR